MLLVSAGFLALSIVAILRLRAWAEATGATGTTADEAPIGGSIWAGLVDIVRSPYLLGICLFLFCYSLLSTFLYYQQAELVPAAITDSAQRTRLLAMVDVAVNLLAMAMQLFAFGALIQRLGTSFMLCLMPVVSIIGFAALAMQPGLVALVAFGVLRRAGEYAVSKPARETLFNVLPPEQKYKAKNVIDTLVHRFGDTASTWIFAGMRSAGMSLSTMSWLAVPIAGGWLAIAAWLGASSSRDFRSPSRPAQRPEIARPERLPATRAASRSR